jgi:hypothetical protein
MYKDPEATTHLFRNECIQATIDRSERVAHFVMAKSQDTLLEAAKNMD